MLRHRGRWHLPKYPSSSPTAAKFWITRDRWDCRSPSRGGSANSPFFNAATRFFGWIKGFEPQNTDMIFDRCQPSCYSSKDFVEVIANSGGNLVIAGFAGEVACPSTAIEAFHRGHNLVFVADASASHPLDSIPACDVHDVITRLISLY